MANKSGIKLLVVAAVVAVGYLGVTAYLRPVALVQAATGGPVAKAVSAQIKIRAEKALEIKLEASGRMLNELKEGQVVAENDILVEIDTRAKEYEIEQSDNALRTTKAQNDVSKRSRESALRQEQATLALKLEDRDKGKLPPVLYAQALEQVTQLGFQNESAQIQADDSVARSETQIKLRKLELANMTLKAPFAGTLTNVQVAKGGVINSGQTVATLITNNRIIEARISEENMAQGVAEGQKVRVWLTGVQSDYHGTIRKILPVQDPQTLRYIAHLDLDIDAAKLEKTGLSGTGVITIDVKQAKVSIPQRALHNNRLYVVKGGRVEIRNPKQGYVSDSVVEILSGLEPGEEVIVDRQDLFQEGDRVRTQTVSVAK